MSLLDELLTPDALTTVFQPIVALGTDGTDGPTDAAGAIVSGDTIARAKTLGTNLRSSLDKHNTYPALKALGCHIHTGPTGTNVNDLYLVLLL